VVIVIDPGHGGRDLGTLNHGIWEHDYVYDVACRLRHHLESRSAARVHMTLEDAETGWTPSADDKLRANYQGTVLTHPPFLARDDGEAEIAVNLRWYLANSIHRKELKAGTDPDRIVFLSIHADSRHPSLRGVMVYVPGAHFREASYGFANGAHERFAEVREKRHVKFSARSRVRSEAVSRKLAEALVRGFTDQKLPVQAFKPVRDRVVRGRRSWLPAVLRGNEVPAKVLVEVLNLSNPDDAALLASAADRDRIAQALMAGLFRHFGEKVPPLPPARAAGRPGTAP
jgi:N-acetylmuramoyl-L-alanine amidase